MYSINRTDQQEYTDIFVDFSTAILTAVIYSFIQNCPVHASVCFSASCSNLTCQLLPSCSHLSNRSCQFHLIRWQQEKNISDAISNMLSWLNQDASSLCAKYVERGSSNIPGSGSAILLFLFLLLEFKWKNPLSYVIISHLFMFVAPIIYESLCLQIPSTT